MSGEPPDAGEEATSPGSAEPDEDDVQVTFNVRASDHTRLRISVDGFPVDQLAFLMAEAIFVKAFLETLGKRTGDGLADLVETRIRKNGKTNEAEISLDINQAARLIVTGDLPDEARLALLDLDVTAPELRGKELRWDEAAGEWRPSGAFPATLNEATSTD